MGDPVKGLVVKRLPSNPRHSAVPYVIQVFGPQQTCTCPAFRFRGEKDELGNGTCKHIKEVMATTCQWSEANDDDLELPSSLQCPRCGGPTVEVDMDARMASSTDISTATATTTTTTTITAPRKPGDPAFRLNLPED